MSAVAERPTKSKRAKGSTAEQPAIDQSRSGPSSLSLSPIAIDAIQPSPFNPRQVADDDPSIAELAQTISEVGLLQPITVRAVKGRKGITHEIVCGERRWRACKHAGLERISAITRVLSDSEAADIVVLENLARQDLHPLEEAKGVHTLLQQYAGSVEVVAAHLGRTPAWVRRRDKIAMLPNEWKQLAKDTESCVSSWTAAHLEIVAVLPDHIRSEIRKDIKNQWGQVHTLGQLRAKINRLTRDLAHAPFDVEDPLLVPKAGACNGCGKRSDAHPTLFEGLQIIEESSPAICFDAECWKKKEAAKASASAAQAVAKCDELKKQKLKPILFDSKHQLDYNAGKKLGVASDYLYRSAKKDDPGARPAVDVSNPTRVRWVKSEQSSRNTAKKPPSPTTPEQLLERRHAWMVDQFVDRLAEITVKQARIPSAQQVYSLCVAFGLEGLIHQEERSADDTEAGAPADPWAFHLWLNEKSQPFELETRLFQSVCQPIGYWIEDGRYRNDGKTTDWERLQKVADAWSLDLTSLEEEAVAAIPEPASWSSSKSADNPAKASGKKGGKAHAQAK